MNKLAVVGIVGALLVLGGVWYVNMEKGSEVTVEPEEVIDSETIIEDESAAQEDDGSDVVEGDAEVKEFVVTGSHMSFDPEEIRVNMGDTVRIVFKSEDMPHDFVLDEFDVATKILNPGEEQTIEFVASEAGEYEYYCSVTNHRALGMVGTLIVK